MLTYPLVYLSLILHLGALDEAGACDSAPKATTKSLDFFRKDMAIQTYHNFEAAIVVGRAGLGVIRC